MAACKVLASVLEGANAAHNGERVLKSTTTSMVGDTLGSKAGSVTLSVSACVRATGAGASAAPPLFPTDETDGGRPEDVTDITPPGFEETVVLADIALLYLPYKPTVNYSTPQCVPKWFWLKGYGSLEM
jgi:hypothetical protein